MKLNSDCIRAVMLSLEDLLVIESDERGNLYMPSVTLNDLCTSLADYPVEDIYYSLLNLDQAGYICFRGQYASGGILIHGEVSDITFAGHEFLGRVRDKERWSAVKAGLAKVRDYSLAAVSSIAEGVTKAAIDKFFAPAP